MTLVEFVLARIEEDEAVVAECLAGDSEPGAWPHSQWDEHWSLLTETSWKRATSEIYIEPRRVLAECASKRRIIGLHSGDAEWCGWTQGGMGTHGDMGNGPADCDTLKALAAPYSDHPDFDPSWSAE